MFHRIVSLFKLHLHQLDVRQHHAVVAGVAEREEKACLLVGMGGGEEEVVGGVALVDRDRLAAVACPGIGVP